MLICPLPTFNIVATNALTIPRRNRLALTLNTKQSFSTIHFAIDILQLKLFTCVCFFEKEVKSVCVSKMAAASCNKLVFKV